jgi:hypothetical protein
MTAVFGFADLAISRTVDLDTWVGAELIPYASQQLSQHPRFKNQTIQLVVLQDHAAQSAGSKLAIDIRNQLRESLNETPGIRILWSSGQSGVGISADGAFPDCSRMQADYYVGVELTDKGSRSISVAIRAFDLTDRRWVSGFGRSWEGQLSSVQLRKHRTSVIDPDFRGERNAPWNGNEVDLMAAHLAEAVGCKLLRQNGAEYVLKRGNSGDKPSGKLIELVSNHLAGSTYIQFAETNVAANAVVNGKAHRIDDDLYQYWITIVPVEAASSLNSLSAAAYVRIEDPYQAASLIPEEAYELAPGIVPFLDNLSVVILPERSSCPTSVAGLRAAKLRFGTDSAGDRHCYALQLRSDEDAVVFFLNHQLKHGLVRLAGGDCSFRTDGRIARRDDTLRFPLPADAVGSGNWIAENRWSLAPREDAYFAIASKNSRAARALSAHVATLPKKCSGSVRPGLDGAALRVWLDELQQILNHWDQDIDWRGVRIKEIY